jgi:hypothetical protein
MVQRSRCASRAGKVSFVMLSHGVTEGVIDSNRGPTPADVGYRR